MLSRFFKKKAVHRNQEPSIQAVRVKPWFAANGDMTHRLDYPHLNKGSLVVDLGGYEGQWASNIFSKYCSNVWVFEPYQPYFHNIVERFSKNEKIKVFDFGLGQSESKLSFSVSEDSSSAFHHIEGASSDTIQLRKASQFLEVEKVNHIDLLKINIEGAEYDLLEHLIESEWIKKISNIQVQFHDFVDNAEERMKNIQINLSKTHQLTYQFEFVWENWELKS